MASKTSVDIFPLLRVLDDGTIQRLMGTDTVLPENNEVPLASHDITLDASKGVYVRVYVPTTTCQIGETLPVVVYIHGGGFCIESAALPTYHNYLNLLSTGARVICVSVDYRRVPEHHLPVPYEDCFSALEWLDIVHQLGIMVSQKSWKRLCVEGTVFVHPFFGGEGSENSCHKQEIINVRKPICNGAPSSFLGIHQAMSAEMDQNALKW